MIRTPTFWHRPRPGLRARLLSPLGHIYGAATARAMSQAGIDVGVPVITVGNFVVGGAGKTPTVIALAQMLRGGGEEPAILARGYGGDAALEAVAVRGQSAGVVGDEALLLARVAPTFVGTKRVRVAQLARESAHPSVLICDDGLQSRVIEPTVALAVVDGRTGIGNGLCVPAGPLRAPLEGQIGFIDALVLVGSGDAGESVAAQAEARGKPCFYADLEPTAAARSFTGERVIAFAGIGMPVKFFATLEAIGARVIATQSFADHHPYTRREIERLQARARAKGAILVTTEKDAVRLPQGIAGPTPRPVGVELVFRDETSVSDFLRRALRPSARG